jgi:hypothetical protein
VSTAIVDGDVAFAASTVAPLALADRCDAPAVVAVLPSDNDLVFCAHHGREHEAALAAAGATVRDLSGTITT